MLVLHIFIFLNIINIGMVGVILPVRLTPKIRKKCRTNRSEGWRTTEKSESNAERMGLKVGGQQKNQSLKETDSTKVLYSLLLKFKNVDTDIKKWGEYNEMCERKNHINYCKVCL